MPADTGSVFTTRPPATEGPGSAQMSRTPRFVRHKRQVLLRYLPVIATGPRALTMSLRAAIRDRECCSLRWAHRHHLRAQKRLMQPPLTAHSRLCDPPPPITVRARAHKSPAFHISSPPGTPCPPCHLHVWNATARPPPPPPAWRILLTDLADRARVPLRADGGRPGHGASRCVRAHPAGLRVGPSCGVPHASHRRNRTV